MKELIILLVCIVAIVIAFISLTVRKPIQKTTMPEGLDEAFRQHCELLLALLTLKVKETHLSRFKLLAEVPFEEGKFEYYSFDYTLTPEKAVADSKGIILNSTELLAKGGLKGQPLLLFYRQGDETAEVTFLDERAIGQKGYRGYINFFYGTFKTPAVDKEYSLSIEGKEVSLWDNIKAGSPFPYAVLTRERTPDLVNYETKFTDVWEGQGLKVYTWVQFEKKRELIYMIKSNSEVAETCRGIHVGSSRQELKQKYPRVLSYEEDFKGAGPCYGFIPKNAENKYIAFFIEDDKVKEIWITDGFSEKLFTTPTGYVDNDVKWIEYDQSEKMTERYAREVYVGQHKSDFDVDKVFSSFISKELHMASVIEKGILEESPGQKIFFIVCQKKDTSEMMHLEVKIKHLKLQNSITGGEIWVITEYRSQIMTDI